MDNGQPNVSNRQRSRFLHLLAAFLLALFVLALYYPLLFTNRVLAGGDIQHYFYPYRDYAAEALRAGQIRLWNPYIFLGAPFLANPQPAVLYPLHWPLSWLSATKQIYWSVALHTWLLGLGGYALLRHWGYGLSAGLTTGLVLAGSGFFGGMVGHINQLNGAAWLPWAVLSVECGVRSAEWRKGVLTFAPLVMLMLLAGHTQTAYINLLGVGVWALARTIDFGTRINADERGFFLKFLSAFIRVYPRPMVVYFAGCVLGGVLAAAQLLPTVELSGLGLRSGGLDYFEATSFSLKPLKLLWTLLPSYGLVDLGVVFDTAGYTEFVAYVGGIGLLLAAVALWLVIAVIGARRKSNIGEKDWGNDAAFPVLCGILFVGLGLFLAFGRWNPVYYLLYRFIPGFDLFRVPARWMMLYTFGMAILAGIGHAEWLRRFPSFREGAVPSRKVRYASLLIPLLLAIDLLLASRSLPHTQTTAHQAVDGVRTAPAFLLTNPARSQIDPAATGRFLSMSTITFDPGDMGDYRRIYRENQPPQLDQRGFEQLVIALKAQEILAPNLPLYWRIPAVDGFDGGVLPLQRYNQFLTLLIPPDQLVPDGRLREQIKQIPPTRLLNLLNVQYVITDKVRDWWFEDVFYDRQIGLRLRGAEAGGIETTSTFEATHLDLLAYVDGDLSPLQTANQNVLEVTLFHDSGETGFLLTAGGQPGAHLADGVLESALAQTGGAVIAYRDVEGGKQEYRVRLPFASPATPTHISLRHFPGMPDVVVQAATLFDQRSKTFLPLLPSDRGHFRMVHGGDVKVYENLDVLSRAYLVHDVIAARDGDEALNVLKRDTFDPSRQAVIQGGEALRTERNSKDEAEMIAYAPERVEIRTRSREAALLVLSDAFYPGWQATVDDQPAVILPTNHLFRGVAVAAGEHRVVFTFAPETWRQGLLLSAIGGILWLLLLGSVLWRR